jgi:arylsulfatase A-like enzyme
VRTDDWKLIRYPHGDGTPDRFTAELYHLASDPLELRNLINDPAAAAKRKELEQELEKLSRAAGPDAMPVYEGIVNVLPKY